MNQQYYNQQNVNQQNEGVLPTQQVLLSEPTKKPLLTVPVAILLGMCAIALAVFAQGWGVSNDQQAGAGAALEQAQGVQIAPITDEDHIIGNPNAEVFIIEYSDFACPFCKMYHNSLQQLISSYGTDGKLAWVYRHFPLYKGSASRPPLHPNAGKIAEASECAAELAGESGFWKFADLVYATTPEGAGIDMNTLPDLAVQAGVDKTAFASCLNSGKYAEKISSDYDKAVQAGARGTPYTVLVNKNNGEPVILDGGAMPFAQLKQIIDAFLAQ